MLEAFSDDLAEQWRLRAFTFISAALLRSSQCPMVELNLAARDV